MLVIIRENKSIAIDWKAVESIQFETSGNNDYLVVITKSESFSVVNPTSESNEKLDFNWTLKAWIDLHTAWRVTEGKDNNAPMQPNIVPPSLNCGYCGEKLDFGTCWNAHCPSKRTVG